MTAHSSIWLYVLICAGISAVCRLLPLLLDINSLGPAPRLFIERLGRYAAVVLLTIILLNVMAGWGPGILTHYGLFIGAVGAFFFSVRGLKPYLAFFLGLSIYAFGQIIAH